MGSPHSPSTSRRNSSFNSSFNSGWGARAAVVRVAGALAVTSALTLAAGTGFLACASPVEDGIIEALGPEAEGEQEGEFHRYGQPCLACHGGYGPGEPTFSFGGTVFAQPDELITVPGAKVTITDANGQQTTMTSNCAGNFYVEQAKYDPVYPVRVEVSCTTPAGFDGITQTYRSVMGTRVNREGSCAACHTNNVPDQNGPGRVYCLDARLPNPWTVDPECQGGPSLEDLGANTSAAAGSSVASSSAASSSSGGVQ